jgi:GTPase Era involved in 16S rRNA processing
MIKCFFKISSSGGNNNETIKRKIDDDIKSAYSKIFVNISDNFNNIEGIFSEKVLEKIPVDLQQELPEILYLKTKEICSNMNYKLKADNVIPEINENTTFEDLYEKWFKNLLGLI